MFTTALEVIDYQVKDKFPLELKEIIDDIFKGFDSGKLKSNEEALKTKHAKEIERLIKDRFNLNIRIDDKLHMYMPAAIIPFSSDYLLKSNLSDTKGHTATLSPGVVFRSNKGILSHMRKIEKDRTKDYKNVNAKKGWIDNKRAVVGGYLGEVRHYLIVNFSFFHGKFTSEEVVAVIIHEIGHAFTGLANHYRLVTTNMALTTMLDDINGNKPEKVFYKYKRYFSPEELINSGLSEDSEIEDFYGPLASKYIDTLDSNILNNKYDETNFEYLADNFATRMGVGKDLVSGLHKLHIEYNRDIQVTKTSFATAHLIDILAQGLLLAINVPVGLVILGLIFATSGKDKEKLTYDIPKDRYNRIRNSIIDNLKNPELPKEYTVTLIKQFEEITKVLDNSITRVSILNILANNIKPGSREAVYYIGAQQAAENALNNTLFVKTAKLKTL